LISEDPAAAAKGLDERAYPAEVEFRTGKSFADTVVALLNNPQLVAALEEAA
jgi:hypothetical protein